jgi:hypothetical protein
MKASLFLGGVLYGLSLKLALSGDDFFYYWILFLYFEGVIFGYCLLPSLFNSVRLPKLLLFS